MTERDQHTGQSIKVKSCGPCSLDEKLRMKSCGQKAGGEGAGTGDFSPLRSQSADNGATTQGDFDVLEGSGLCGLRLWTRERASA